MRERVIKKYAMCSFIEKTIMSFFISMSQNTTKISDNLKVCYVYICFIPKIK